VRLRVWLLAFAAVSFGCGDGVGRPISEQELRGTGSSGASSGGSSAAPSDGQSPGAGAPTGGAAFTPGGGRGGGDFGPPRNDGGMGWDGRGPRQPVEKGAVPEGSYCESVADWDPAADEREQRLVQFMNLARESGIGCGTETAVVGPLVATPELRCAARLHARDMSERGFFDHVNPDGVGPEERMRRAGATFRIASESITHAEWNGPGSGAPWESISDLLTGRAEDCKNVADPGFDRVGVGLYGELLTLDFAGP